MEDDRKRTRLRKSLRLYLSRTLKIPPIHIPSSAANMTSAPRLLSTCRIPRTPSLDLDGDHAAADMNNNSKQDQAATLPDVDRFLFDNFRSLYIHDNNNDPPSAGTSTSVVNGTPAAAAETSSLSESASEDIVKEDRPGDEEEGGDSAAILTFYMDPYIDFRRSMQDMIKMHHGCLCQPLDWDFGLV